MYGIPEAMTFDNGTEFNNETMKQLLQLHKVKLHFITPHNPESNGLIERLHSTILEHLRLLKANHKQPIKLLMCYAIIAYNNSIHSITRKTPNELLFGHTNLNNPFDLNFEQRCYHEYMQTHKTKLHKLYDEVQQKAAEAKEKTITNRNRNLTEADVFKIGQQVFEKIESNNRNKLTNKYKGPFVLKEINNDYTAEIIDKNKTRKIAVRNLRHPIVPDVAASASRQNPALKGWTTIRDYFLPGLEKPKTSATNGN